jgi:hypothetical protein
MLSCDFDFEVLVFNEDEKISNCAVMKKQASCNINGPHQKLLTKKRILKIINSFPDCFYRFVRLLHSREFLVFFPYPEDGGDTFLRNVGFNQLYTAQDPRRLFIA